VLRSGAKPGQDIYVTGELGGAAATLARLAESKPVGAKYSMSSTGTFPGNLLRKRGLLLAKACGDADWLRR